MHCCIVLEVPSAHVLLLQIQDFSSGFFSGTKLACWVKGESPWGFFPKISIYLRATNTSQSFRLTVLPQVGLILACYKNSLYDNPYRWCHPTVSAYSLKFAVEMKQMTLRQDCGFGLGKLIRHLKNFLLK